MIPSEEECFDFMDRYKMPDHIRAHSIIVEKVAHLIAKRLQEKGARLSLAKVMAGALMHDIAKALCFKSPEDHAAKGEEICLRNDLEGIAEIVGEHIRLKTFNREDEVHEKEIVYYADKRANHDRIVSLEERVDYLMLRYARNNESIARRIRENFKLCKEVEAKIFSRLNFSPCDLVKMIQ